MLSAAPGASRNLTRAGTRHVPRGKVPLAPWVTAGSNDRGAACRKIPWLPAARWYFRRARELTLPVFSEPRTPQRSRDITPGSLACWPGPGGSTPSKPRPRLPALGRCHPRSMALHCPTIPATTIPLRARVSLSRRRSSFRSAGKRAGSRAAARPH